MADNTGIEWCDATWSPVTGCSPISTGCQNCWARKVSKRLRGRFGYPQDEPFRVTFHPDRLEQPQHWKKPRRIFVCSMGDLFHEDVKTEWIEEILRIGAVTPRHTFQFLTKRPERMRDILLEMEDRDGFYGHSNLWFGTSVENQATADERIPYLLRCPAAVRYVSLEPLLSAIDIRPYLGDNKPVQHKGGQDVTYQEEGRGCVQGSSAGRIGDRFDGTGMASGGPTMESVAEADDSNSMQKTSGRKQVATGLFTGKGDVPGTSVQRTCCPPGMETFSRTTSSGADDQPQKREQGRQPAEKPGIGDIFRTSPSCDKDSQGASGIESMGGGQPDGETHSEGRCSDSQAQGGGRKAAQHSSGLSREFSDNIGHRKGPSPISWLIVGAESIGSRPGRECRIEWIESLYYQAKLAGVPIFVKQLHLDGKLVKDVSKFPKHLRVQEYPA